MPSQNAVRGYVVFLCAAVVCGLPAAAGAQSQYGSFAATGPYANMPGQPGAPPAYMMQGQISQDSDQTSSPVVIQAPPGASDNSGNAAVASNEAAPSQDDSAAPSAEASNPPPPPPPIQEAIVYHPPEKPEPEKPPYMGLETRSGIDLGLQASHYHFNEPNTNEITGVEYGGLFGVTGVVGDHFFGTIEGRYAKGWLDYKGSSTGSFNDRPNDLWEARGLVGKDFIFTYFSVSPYAGFAYRYVDADLRGTTSTGVNLYQNENSLFYVPVGLRPRIRLDADSRLATEIEYDFPIQGQETSHLNDLNTGNPAVRNEQFRGSGLRGEIMYETKYWSFGPFADYWMFHTTDPSIFHSPNSTCGSTTCSFTYPFNHTLEVGLQFKFHLF